MTARRRIDQMLVERGLVETRQKAQALILAGQVLVNGQKAAKPGHAVPADVRLEILAPLRYVSRGGLKLEAALAGFGIDPAEKVCLDIGSSTGGFTDCLLQHGAARVYAIDTGKGQLAWKLRNDPRVVLRENVNARYLTPEHVPEPADLAVCDVSFISVTRILPALPPMLKDDAELVILVKPQFEAGKGQVGKGGIVRDPEIHRAVCERVRQAVESLGFRTALMESPILGAEGNKEFLLHGTH